MDLDDFLRSRGSGIQGNDMDRCCRFGLIRRRDRKLDIPDRWRSRRPNGTQNRSRITIEGGKIRRGRVRSECGSGFIPGGFDTAALPVAGLVPARDEDHPCLWARARGCRGTRAEDGLPVIFGKGSYVLSGNFGSASVDWGRERGGKVGFCFVEPVLEVIADLFAQGLLGLRDYEGGKREQEEGLREMHDDRGIRRGSCDSIVLSIQNRMNSKEISRT